MSRNGTPPSIAISIPAYNEEFTLEPVVQNALRVLASLTDDYEVVVINDGSTDGTRSLCARLAENPHIRVHHHEMNLGFGPTLKEVLTLPQKDWVFFIPGDGQIPPEELHKLWLRRDQGEVILGWRLYRKDPVGRRLTAGVYNLLISLLMGRRVHDIDSVVFFQRAVADRFALKANSVFIHAEFCLRAVKSGARLLEIPIEHRPRLAGDAKGNHPGVILKTISDLMCYLFKK